MNWQPIETAPKDGSNVLLYCPDAVEPGIIMCAFLEFEGDPDPGEWYPVDAPDGGPLDVEPSHWLPLPPTPPRA